jgi:membrane fusion protein (multidrug efflux system)
VQVDKAQADYDKAKADFDRVDALKNDVAISKQDYDQTKSNFEVAAAALEDAKNQLGYCTITAPSDGFIGNRTVNVGNRVQVGGALMSVVQGVWVLANFKETQLGKMKEGQQVAITVDAIPSHTFPGYINSFSPGTGSTFALLPPDNATGNFTKIVQRVPVKILFDPNGIGDFRNRLVPGLSVEISVDLNAPLVQEPREVSKLSQ